MLDDFRVWMDAFAETNVEKVMGWLIDLYGAFGAKYPRGSLCVVMVMGIVLSGGAWKYLGFLWNSREATAGAAPTTVNNQKINNGNHNQNIQTNNSTAKQDNEK